MSKRKAILCIIVVFILSILIRTPTLQRSVSIWRDYNTAFFLIPMMIWDETGGPSQHNFMHSATFNNLGDKNNPHIGSLNFNETCYYHSFPTLSLVLPYYAFKLFHVTPSPIAIRIFNLLLNAITILLIFEILWLILPMTSHSSKIISAMSGALVYLFAPGSMFYHGNGYTHHVLVVPLVLATVYFYFSYVQRQEKSLAFLFLLFLFLSMITEWVGYFLAFGLTVTHISLQRKKSIPIAFAICSVGVIALGCFLFPPVQKFGFDTFIEQVLSKFNERSFSSTTPNASFISIITGITQHFKSMYLPVLALLAWFLGVAFFKKTKLNLSKAEVLTLTILFFCAWVHHVVFLNFTLPHDYSILNDLSYLSLAVGILLFRVGETFTKRVNLFVGILFITISVTLYFHYNRPGKLSIDGEPYDYTEKMAAEILKHAEPKEVIFIQSFTGNASFCPPMAYHLKRNYYIFLQEGEIEQVAKEKNIDHYIIVFTSHYQVTRIKKL